MNDDSGQERRTGRVPRVALLACLALVIVSLGVALNPGRPDEPAEPPFSEQARSAALADTMRLRDAGEQLGQSTSAGARPALTRTVSLLTDQARALLVPSEDKPVSPFPAGRPSPSAAAATPLTSSASSFAASSAPLPVSAAALATELAASASYRLADAAVADGGMARVLAAVGTAQLLEASSLAADIGTPAPAVPDPAAPPLSGACPSAPAPPSSSSASGTLPQAAPATLPAALAAVVETELETVYGYQVALTRLGGAAAGPASKQLLQHEDLAAGAEELARMHCGPVPPRVAGYQMDQSFLASPAAGLGGLEASALPVYGDLVALSEGQTRQWAISGLVGAARRAALWGAETGALPGLAADPAGFPELPAPAVTPSP